MNKIMKYPKCKHCGKRVKYKIQEFCHWGCQSAYYDHLETIKWIAEGGSEKLRLSLELRNKENDERNKKFCKEHNLPLKFKYPEKGFNTEIINCRCVEIRQ
jgi:hypothetical protein